MDSPVRLPEQVEHVRALLQRQRLLAELTHRQQGPKRDLLEALQNRQSLGALRQHLRGLHPADLAHILESLPHDERLLVWHEIDARQAAQVLPELSGRVRTGLLDVTSSGEQAGILGSMDPEDLAWLADDVDPQALAAAYERLDAQQISWLRASEGWPDDTVGQLMTHDLVATRDTATLGDALEDLRARASLPRQADALFVVDARNVLRGVLPLRELLLSPAERPIVDAMQAAVTALAPGTPAALAAQDFERYDLVSAPVCDERGKLVGRLTVEAVMDFVRRRAERQALGRAGLAGEEDLFASARASARNRWLWLAVNLVTAFAASRVIGFFESTIGQLVALATLMPIVASVGGNTGNQTVAVMIRSLALGQLSATGLRHLFVKELQVSVMNGLVWGSVMGLFALALYRNAALGAVMATAILLNLLVAAVVGIVVPLVLHHAGRDPAQRASVLLTFTTDSMGFFLFLALAKAFLV